MNENITILSNERLPRALAMAYPQIVPSWVHEQAGKLYRARLNAAKKVTTPYFVLLDGGSDRIPANWPQVADLLVSKMREDDSAIGYGNEKINGESTPHDMHHSVIVDTEKFNSVDWPMGCYWFEGIVYPKLVTLFGKTYLPELTYDWRPGDSGASKWPSTVRARLNSQFWQKGIAGVHFNGDT